MVSSQAVGCDCASFFPETEPILCRASRRLRPGRFLPRVLDLFRIVAPHGRRWRMTRPGAIVLVALLSGTVARAGEPVAIVEEVSGGAAVEPFSYLQEGAVIELGTEGRVVIGSLASCIQETVRGGVVTIGKDRSTVDGGERSARRLRCGGAAAELSQDAAERGAVLVMRRPARSATPRTVLRYVSPFIAPRGSARSVRLTRLDRSEEDIIVALRDGVADLAVLDVALTPGGTYRVRADGSETVIAVANDARQGAGPILVRLLSF